MSHADVGETICAIASPRSPAPRGIVRVTGADAVAMVHGILQDPPPFPRRRAQRVPALLAFAMAEGRPAVTVPVAAMVWPDSRSYTGQPTVELHLPGSLPLLEAAVERLVAAGARPARPGEFTLRAFLAGRLDLTQAEAVLGVIDADNDQALGAALEQLAGGVSGPLLEVRGRLLDLLAHLEAGLDFVEEDIEFIDRATLEAGLREATQTLVGLRRQLRERSGSTDLPRVVLRGRPNAGKSRLLNALVGEEAAIVADAAGTTRDAIEAIARLGQHEVRICDTAGLERPSGPIEQAAQAAAESAQQHAAVRLVCWDPNDGLPPPELPAASAETVTLWVRTKADLGGPAPGTPWIETSGVTGNGLAVLREQLAAALDVRHQETPTGVAGTAARCGAALDAAIASLKQALPVVTGDAEGHEWVAAEMRLALSALGEVTGEVYTDDILDRIFSRFCIGK